MPGRPLRLRAEARMSPRVRWSLSCRRARSPASVVACGLVDNCVDLLPEPVELDRGCAGEHQNGRLGRNEGTLPKRRQLPHWDAVTSHEKGLAPVEPPHYLAASIPELALRDRPRHPRSVGTRATSDGH